MVEPMRTRGDDAAVADVGLPNIRIVLVRPRGSANVGAAARAMKNTGAGELTLVRPAVRRYAAAEAMAVHARDLVRRARMAPNLAEAVADCALVVGTTCRDGGYRRSAEDIERVAPAILAAAVHGPVGILFGPEDHGLTNEDLRHCQRLITLDTSPAYASLNLAQAVLLVCYELRRIARGPQPPLAALSPAPGAAVQRMFEHLQRALLRIGFLHPQNPEHLMFALRRMFGRGGLEDHEVRILHGIARQIEWFAQRGAAAPAAPMPPLETPSVRAAAGSRPRLAGRRTRLSQHG